MSKRCASVKPSFFLTFFILSSAVSFLFIASIRLPWVFLFLGSDLWALICLNTILVLSFILLLYSSYNSIISSLFLISTSLLPSFFFQSLNFHNLAHFVIEFITYSLSVHISISILVLVSIFNLLFLFSIIVLIPIIHAFNSAILFVIGLCLILIETTY